MSELENAYAAAFRGWQESEDGQLWDNAAGRLPTQRLADLPMPESTGDWDGRDSAEVVSELREDIV